MKNALILHGTLGSPEGNWFQWLKDQLEAEGLQVWLPQLPHAEQPSLKEWANFVHTNCPSTINEDTLIVGHSSGAILALILAQQNPEPIGEIICVSVFHDNSLQWEPNNKLFDMAMNWEAIRANAKKLLFVHSDNDPYVPLEQARFVADNCQAELITIPDQGHFNLEQSEEYKLFPRLLEIIESTNVKHSPSAGGIILNNRNKVLLVNEGDGFWGFPKGRPEKDETLLEAAIREIAEETGLTGITKVAKLGKYERHPVWEGAENKTEIKDITLFLFRTDQELTAANTENNECAWLAIEQVASKLSHAKDREFFEEAISKIL